MSTPTHRVLRLTLKRKWFDLIASGEKREEYRTPGKWILSRLEGKEYDVVEFKNGYGPNVPTMVVEFLGWNFSFGRRAWGGGAEPGNPFATIQLGRVLYVKNLDGADTPQDTSDRITNRPPEFTKVHADPAAIRPNVSAGTP